MENTNLQLIINCAISFFGIIVTTVIAYHIHTLSKKTSFRDRLKHQEVIRNYITKLQTEIHSKGRSHKIILIDVDVYDRYYPRQFNNYCRHSHFSGELKDATFDGIEVIEGLSYISKIDKESYGLIEGEKENAIKTIKVGVIPYEWIVDINWDGDGFHSSAIMYCKFHNRTFWKFKRGEKMNSETGEFYKPKIGYLSRIWSPFKINKYYLFNPRYSHGTDHYWEQYLYPPIKVVKNNNRVNR